MSVAPVLPKGQFGMQLWDKMTQFLPVSCFLEAEQLHFFKARYLELSHNFDHVKV
jgi:hypothetical protein